VVRANACFQLLVTAMLFQHCFKKPYITKLKSGLGSEHNRINRGFRQDRKERVKGFKTWFFANPCSVTIYVYIYIRIRIRILKHGNAHAKKKIWASGCIHINQWSQKNMYIMTITYHKNNNNNNNNTYKSRTNDRYIVLINFLHH